MLCSLLHSTPVADWKGDGFFLKALGKLGLEDDLRWRQPWAPALNYFCTATSEHSPPPQVPPGSAALACRAGWVFSGLLAAG